MRAMKNIWQEPVDYFADGFVKMDLAVSGRWQILQKSDKSSKWEVPRGQSRSLDADNDEARLPWPFASPDKPGLHSL